MSRNAYSPLASVFSINILPHCGVVQTSTFSPAAGAVPRVIRPLRWACPAVGGGKTSLAPPGGEAVAEAAEAAPGGAVALSHAVALSKRGALARQKRMARG